MSGNNAGPDASASGITQEQLDAAVATARSEGEKAGAVAERDRIKAILDGDEAKDRDDLARHFAFDTDQSPEAANAALSKSPKAKVEAKDDEDFADRKDKASANADIDLGGPVKTEKQHTGLSKAVDRYAPAA